MAVFIVSYSEDKDRVIRSLKGLGAEADDLGFNNLEVRYDGPVEKLEEVDGVTEAKPEANKWTS